MPESTMQWLARRRQERLEQAEADARRFFDGTEQEIPNLEFETPVCPICDLHTEFDGDCFLCDVCGVTWSSNGYDGETIKDHPMRSVTATRERRADPSQNGSSPTPPGVRP